MLTCLLQSAHNPPTNQPTHQIHLYGIPAIDVKPVLQVLASLFESRNAKLRQLAQPLALELYRWAPSVVRKQLSGLRKAQLTELEKAWDAYDASGAARPSPSRYRRHERPSGFAPEANSTDFLSPVKTTRRRRSSSGSGARSNSRSPASSDAAAAAGAGGGAGVGAGSSAGASTAAPAAAPIAQPAFDEYSLADEVDLLAKLPKIKLESRVRNSSTKRVPQTVKPNLTHPRASLSSTQLQEAKWGLRAAAIDDVVRAIGSTPKLAPGDYSDLLSIVKAAIKVLPPPPCTPPPTPFA